MPKPSTKRWNKFDKGQKELGRKRRPYYLTDSENIQVAALIALMRDDEKINGLIKLLSLTDSEKNKVDKYLKDIRS